MFDSINLELLQQLGHHISTPIIFLIYFFYGRSLLVISFKHSSVYMSIPNSQSAPFAMILSTQSVKCLHTWCQLSTPESIWWQHRLPNTRLPYGCKELRNQGRQSKVGIASRLFFNVLAPTSVLEGLCTQKK